MKRCIFCNKQLDEGDLFCTQCGKRTVDIDELVEKDKTDKSDGFFECEEIESVENNTDVSQIDSKNENEKLQYSNQSNRNLKFVIIGLGILLCVALCCIIILLSSSKDNSNVSNDSSVTSGKHVANVSDENVYRETMPDSEDKIIKNISTSIEKMADGNYIIWITNNNDYAIPDCIVGYWGVKNDEKSDYKEQWFFQLLPGKTMPVITSYYNPSEKYDTVDYKIKVTWEDPNFRSYDDNLKVKTEMFADCSMDATFTNTGDKDIDEIEVVVIYYNDKDQPICGQKLKTPYSLKAGESATEHSSVPSYNKEIINQISKHKDFTTRANSWGL